MKTTIALLILAVLAIGSGCQSTPEAPRRMTWTEPVTVEETLAAGPVERIDDRDDPTQVVAFARSLAAAGRHAEAAAIYEDAAGRFESVGGRFEADCRKSAVREHWLAGDIAKARATLDRLEAELDLYDRAAEEESLRQLRQLLNHQQPATTEIATTE